MTLTPQEARVLDFCKRRPVVTLAQVCSVLCLAPITIHRALKKHGYFSSINHNARYYTLADKPHFADNGLWFYRSIAFSCHRTLPRALVALVQQASAGATPAELVELLRTPVHNLLASLARQQQLARRRLGHRVVYLDVDPQRQEQQWWQRQQLNPIAIVPELLPASLSLEEVLPVLVELIRFPQASAEQLAGMVRNNGQTVRPADVQTMLGHFQLEKKEARYRSQNSSRNCFVPVTTTCSDSRCFRKPPFSPLIAWPRRLRPARGCPLSSRHDPVAWSVSASAPCVVAKSCVKQTRSLARAVPAWSGWCRRDCVTPTM
jgi:hypothetical protein